MAEYRQKKIAMINDLSGYGRCSLTVAIPILSAMKIQCCPIPTSILSNHTGFPVYFFDDYSEKIPAYIKKWKELKLSFDGVVSGFLGSEAQIEMVKEIIRDFGSKDTAIIIDPIMGDHGETYATFTSALCTRMRELVAMGNVVTPNLTEACILTDRPFCSQGWTREKLKALARNIQDMGPRAVVITGVNQGGYVVNVVADGAKEITFLKTIRIGRERPGTGDVFSSVIASCIVAGWELNEAVRLAASFVKKCIRRSEELDIPLQNGVCFEELLGVLVHAADKKSFRT